MAMKQCPVCGEKYSETYKNCPFCEEEEALRESEGGHRSRRGKRAARSRQFSLITPTLIVLIVIMASLLVYLLYGSQLSERFGGKDDPDTEEVTDPVEQEDPADQDGTEDQTGDPEGTMPDTVDDGTEDSQTEDTSEEDEGTETADNAEYDRISALPDGLTLSTTDFTLFNLGETAAIKVTSGGSGTYTWVSEDDGIASVDSSGKVTAVSGGTVNVLVTDGTKKGTCIVRVKATGTLPTAPSAQTGSGSYKLNSEDFTRSISEGSYQLTVSGVSSGITWTSSNTGVATVDSSGKVTPVGVGTATITASFNGQSLSCIVRVPR